MAEPLTPSQSGPAYPAAFFRASRRETCVCEQKRTLFGDKDAVFAAKPLLNRWKTGLGKDDFLPRNERFQKLMADSPSEAPARRRVAADGLQGPGPSLDAP